MTLFDHTARIVPINLGSCSSTTAPKFFTCVGMRVDLLVQQFLQPTIPIISNQPRSSTHRQPRKFFFERFYLTDCVVSLLPDTLLLHNTTAGDDTSHSAPSQ